MRVSTGWLSTILLKFSYSCLRIMQTLLNLAQFILANMWRGPMGMDLCQVVWALLSAASSIWLISQSGPVV